MSCESELSLVSSIHQPTPLLSLSSHAKGFPPPPLRGCFVVWCLWWLVVMCLVLCGIVGAAMASLYPHAPTDTRCTHT